MKSWGSYEIELWNGQETKERERRRKRQRKGEKKLDIFYGIQFENFDLIIKKFKYLKDLKYLYKFCFY